jgi:hypothetical protein
MVDRPTPYAANFAALQIYQQERDGRDLRLHPAKKRALSLG